MMCVKNKAVMAVVVSAAVLLPASAGAQSSGSPVQVERIDNPSLAEHLVTPVRVWRNPAHDPRAVVLLIHGFPEHGLLYEKLATKLVEAGYIVYAPDMRGLGRAYSTGAATKISYVRHGDDDLIRLAELLHQNHKGLPLFVGGESMGGAFAIRLAAQHPELVDGVILSGAAVELEHHYARLIPRSLLNILTLHAVKIDFSKQIAHFFSADPRIARELLCDPLVRKSFDTGELMEVRRMPRLTEKYVSMIPPSMPVLVLQACDDHQTKPSILCLFKTQLRSQDVTYAVYSHGGHTILQSEYIDGFAVQTVREWLDKHVGPPLAR